MMAAFYKYELIEAGYVYAQGELEADNAGEALDMAAVRCKAGSRDTYMPDDGSPLEVVPFRLARGGAA